MTARQQALFWFVLVAVFGLLLFLLRDMLLPFVLGMAVAYLADPFADKLEDWGLSRALATTVITLLFFAIVLVAAFLIVPVIAGQLIGLIERLPVYMEKFQATVVPLLNRVLTELPATFGAPELDWGREALSQYSKNAVQWFVSLGAGLWNSGLALLNLLSLLVITPVVAFYLLWEWDVIVARVDEWLPRRHAGRIRGLVEEIDRVLAGFVRGQGTVCGVLGLFYGVALSLVGLEFGFIIGLASGALSFIPFVGAIFGAIASIGVALVQFWPEWLPIAGVAVIYLVGQVIEGNFLTPKLVGSRVGLHPVWVIFGLLAGGVLFGFVGMLLALPATAVIGVLVRHGLAEYLTSHFYLDASMTAADGDVEVDGDLDGAGDGEGPAS